jgi:hypothetical protein
MGSDWAAGKARRMIYNHYPGYHRKYKAQNNITSEQGQDEITINAHWFGNLT